MTSVPASDAPRSRGRSRVRKVGAAGLAGVFLAAVVVAPAAAAFAASGAGPAFAAESGNGAARIATWAGYGGQESQSAQALRAADVPALPIDVGVAQPEEGPIARAAAQYTLQQFLFSGVVNWGGHKFTYYSQQVLPGGGLNIPGRHVNDDGFVSDAEGFIVLAGSAPLGTVYDTPFGYQGKIYDRGTVGNHLDVYIR